MRFTKHDLDIPVRNLEDITAAKKPEEKRHGALLPNNLRMICCGPSQCDKTNLLLSPIESPNGIKFENLYVYSKTLQQDKYKYLAEMLTPIKEIGFYAFSSMDDVIAPSEAKRNSVVIFDDVICEKSQDNVRELFCMGRHYDTDVIYLTQTFTKLSKHLIRDKLSKIPLI